MLTAERKGDRCDFHSPIAHFPAGNSSANNTTPGGGADLSNCPEATLLTADDYKASIVASFGELPGVVFCLVLVDFLGRRATVGYAAFLTGVVFVGVVPCISQGYETFLFSIGRGASEGYFQLIYLFTSELYPSDIRGTAMGMGSAVARVGFAFTPYVAQVLDNIDLYLAAAVYALTAFGATVVTRSVTIETTGREMLASMNELVGLLNRADSSSGGDYPDSDSSGRGGSAGKVTFAKDPAAPALLRLLRWSAIVDGYAAAGSSTSDDSDR